LHGLPQFNRKLTVLRCYWIRQQGQQHQADRSGDQIAVFPQVLIGFRLLKAKIPALPSIMLRNGSGSRWKVSKDQRSRRQSGPSGVSPAMNASNCRPDVQFGLVMRLVDTVVQQTAEGINGINRGSPAPRQSAESLIKAA
jgi:hypothetical protein